MSKNQKGRRHRSVNRTPRPAGPAPADRPQQSQIAPRQPFHLVSRELPHNIGGRLYFATARLRVDDEVMEFDLLASLHGIVSGEVAGDCAAMLTAAAFSYLQQAPVENRTPVSHLGCDFTRSPAAMIDSVRAFVAAGLVGRDENGGYFDLDRHRAIGRQREADAVPPHARLSEVVASFEPDGPVFYNKARVGGLGHHAAATWKRLKALGSAGATPEDLSTSVGYTLPTIHRHLAGLARYALAEETGGRWRATKVSQWEAARQHGLPVRSSV
ncbi:hypothetical protein OG756_34245 [Streptomyces sp. NBC_01310]|uniref:hypothetical protein n=1 Tax=Streptomyces sp. NBC_01310 TaxID=2903820 RepID=UPI0035B57A76|nr:hypothetical protein OG756_34245 [Streptomyces sp. NBC_01310]